MKKIHMIHLTDAQRSNLNVLIHKGKENTRVITRARVLLLAHEGKKDPDIFSYLHLSTKTPYEIRKRYHEGGLNKALYDSHRPGKKRILSGEQEAEVVAIACTKAPKGYAHWTLDVLTETIKGKLKVKIGRNAIWKVLLRSNLKPWREKNVVYS